MVAEDVWSHFGMRWAVGLWIVIYGVFLLFVPFSMFAIGWFFGFTLPEGILWGHTLVQYIGFWGMYLGILISLTGVALVVSGWNQIHKNYWSKEEGQRKLVTTGIYRYIRHPQYTGFFMITLGMMLEWATLPLIILYSLLLSFITGLQKKKKWI